MLTLVRERLSHPTTRALGWLALSLLCLVVGRFIQFDDTSGFGSDEWNLLLAPPAAVAAGASLVGVSTPSARRALGWVGCGLVVWLVWSSSTDDGFRFIWGADEGDLFLFEVPLGLISLALLATGVQPTASVAAGTGNATWPPSGGCCGGPWRSC